jgi:hypothetical protein
VYERTHEIWKAVRQSSRACRRTRNENELLSSPAFQDKFALRQATLRGLSLDLFHLASGWPLDLASGGCASLEAPVDLRATVAELQRIRLALMVKMKTLKRVCIALLTLRQSTTYPLQKRTYRGNYSVAGACTHIHAIDLKRTVINVRNALRCITYHKGVDCLFDFTDTRRLEPSSDGSMICRNAQCLATLPISSETSRSSLILDQLSVKKVVEKHTQPAE